MTDNSQILFMSGCTNSTDAAMKSANKNKALT